MCVCAAYTRAGDLVGVWLCVCARAALRHRVIIDYSHMSSSSSSYSRSCTGPPLVHSLFCCPFYQRMIDHHLSIYLSIRLITLSAKYPTYDTDTLRFTGGGGGGGSSPPSPPPIRPPAFPFINQPLLLSSLSRS
eukprot:GHVU01035831.1.p1 GENE.GHVU01035831.1~~GHVU01035831.1.p1  ORF type:complete len:134 (+),score=16.79 GHVU01035831.1:389-790(+)